MSISPDLALWSARTSRQSSRRLVVAALLAIALLVGYGSATTSARAADMPTVSIDMNDTLAQVQAAVTAAGPEVSVELINWSTLSVNTRAVCAAAVVITLYSLSAGVVAYLATAGAVVTIAGFVITAGQLAAFAAGLIKWQDVFTYAETNICT